MTSTPRQIETDGEERHETPRGTDTGIDENVAGALSYLFGFVTGIIFYVIDDRSFVRFHAAQSLAITGIFFVAAVATSVLQIVVVGLLFGGGGGGFVVGSLLSLVLGLVWLALTVGGFVLWIYLMLRAYQGETPRIPIAAGLADNLV